MNSKANAQNPIVLVLGHGNRAFLQAIRSLGRKGIRIDVNLDQSIAMKSRYIEKIVSFPRYTPENATVWIEEVISLCKERGYSLILPCTDDMVLPLVTHREKLPETVQVVAPSVQAYSICSDKQRSLELVASCGLPVPESIDLEINPLLVEAVRSLSWSYPVILKPHTSYSAADANPKQRAVCRIRSEKELIDYIETHRELGRILLQRNCSGYGVGVYLLAKSGRILTGLAQERLHEPLEGGGGHYRRSIALPDKLMPGMSQVIEKLDYTGVIMFEWKYDIRTKKWTFIEINPRFWGSLALSIAAGLDFPYWLYEMYTKDRNQFPTKYREGIYCRNLIPDCHWIMDNFRADKSDNSLATKPLLQVLGECRHILLGREYWDSFSWDDLSPFGEEVRAFARLGGEKIIHSLNRLRGALFPRWRGKILSAFAFKSAVKNSRNILIICKGNICRSPFAASVMNSLIQNIPERKEVISIRQGGYYPKEGRGAPAKALEVAKKMGYSLDSHRSRLYTSEDLDWADIILCFDEENYDRLYRELKNQKQKIWPLGAALAKKNPWIVDPYSGTVERFEQVYRDIERACREILFL